MWVMSSKLKDIKATIEIHNILIKMRKDTNDTVIHKDLKITANSKINIMSEVIDNIKVDSHILAACLFIDDKVVARDIDWPQPLKYLSFKDQVLKVTCENESTICVMVEKPVKGLVFEEREDAILSDSGLEIATGDEQIIKVKH